ncbi:hypothetical protein QG37_07280 [Candidozyma auris]|nr:hypothetical protein QG37_07280 [[Candida] auris]
MKASFLLLLPIMRPAHGLPSQRIAAFLKDKLREVMPQGELDKASDNVDSM